MQNQKRLVAEGKDLTSLVLTSTKKLDHGFNTVVSQQDRLMESQETQIRLLQQVLNQSLNTLKATSKQGRLAYLDTEDSIDGYKTPRGLSPSPSPGTGQDLGKSRQRLRDLLKSLDLDFGDDTAAKDASTLLHRIGNLSSGSQDRAVALITSPIMQRWLTSTASLPLMVNGHMYSKQEEIRQSPLSYFCAKLIDSIVPARASAQAAANPSIFAVQWFCGQHTDYRDYGPDKSDYEAHPPGMLSNMLGQLIVQLLKYPLLPSLEHLSAPGHNPSLSDLCILFSSLVEALPTGSLLFIIIDGISYYEDDERREECMEVLSTLTGMARGGTGSTGGRFIKLLVTAPLRSHYVRDLFDDAEILDLPEYLAPSGGFTALQWDMGVGRMIGDA